MKDLVSKKIRLVSKKEKTIKKKKKILKKKKKKTFKALGKFEQIKLYLLYMNLYGKSSF